MDKKLVECCNDFGSLSAKLSGILQICPHNVRLSWTNYLRISMEPTGWNAVWKVSRIMCGVYKLPFPTFAFVKVNNVYFDLITAQIRVLHTDDENVVSLPNKIDVPLKDLYVTEEQEFGNDLDIVTTADCLDLLRVFYNHLWWPWDEESDTNWVEDHFPDRLTLYGDTKYGKLCVVAEKTIHSLLEDGRRLFSELSERNDEESDDNVVENAEFQLLKAYDAVKLECSYWENPATRRLLDEEMSKEMQKMGVVIVKKECDVAGLVDLAAKVSECLNDPKFHIIKITDSVKDALLCTAEKQVVLISPGVHYLLKTKFVHCSRVKGLAGNASSSILIMDKMSNRTMLECYGTEFLMEDLTVNAGFCDVILQARKGRCIFKNVAFLAENRFKIADAAVVAHGGTVSTFENCRFVGFEPAILALDGSQIEFIDCRFDCGEDAAVKVIGKEAKIKFSTCEFSLIKGNANGSNNES